MEIMCSLDGFQCLFVAQLKLLKVSIRSQVLGVEVGREPPLCELSIVALPFTPFLVACRTNGEA